MRACRRTGGDCVCVRAGGLVVTVCVRAGGLVVTVCACLQADWW